jgi:hypothetical protein
LFKRFRVLIGSLFFLLISCSSDEVSLVKNGPYIAVTSVTTAPATGPGIASVYNRSGELVTILKDYAAGGAEFGAGIAHLGSLTFAIAVDGTDRVDIVNMLTGSTSALTNGALTATPIRHLATDTEKSIFVVESNLNTIEKFTAAGSRVGNPFIATTTAPCVLASPWGVAVNPTTNRIAVISSAAAGRFSLYNSDGSCNTHVTAAPFNSGTPTAIAYHPTTGRWLVTFATTHAIYAVSETGGSPTLIYQNSTLINTPRAIASDSEGNIYVGSDGTDTVEKLYWSGTGSATRALAGPFAGPGINTQNPTAITVAE